MSERAHEPGGARAAGVGMALISCALAVVSAIALLLWLVVGLGWPGATFGGVAVTLLAMPALAVYLTQQYDQPAPGREDFRATALCEAFSRAGTMGLACAAALVTASPTWTRWRRRSACCWPAPSRCSCSRAPTAMRCCAR